MEKKLKSKQIKFFGLIIMNLSHFLKLTLKLSPWTLFIRYPNPIFKRL